MGADLYIKKIHDPHRAKYEPLFKQACAVRDAVPEEHKAAAQEAVEYFYELMDSKGYFRDSYNSTSVLWTLGLSWWEDVGKLLTDKCNLEGENLKRFRAMVADANQKLPTKEELEAGHVNTSDGLENWHTYYRDKRERLLAFLDTAISLDEPIYCSV